jgi:hypothetical protein
VLRVKISQSGHKMGIKRLPRMQDAKDEMKQVAHDSSDDQQLGLSGRQQALSKVRENRIIALSDDGREIEGDAQSGRTAFGQAGATSHRGAGQVVGGVKPAKAGNWLALVKA